MKKEIYTIRMVTTLDDTLIMEWKALWKRAEHATVFNSYEWYLTAKEINKLSKYRFYLCYEDDRLVAIMPMEVYKVYGVSVLGTINKEQLIDTGFLMESYDKKIFNAFFSELFRHENVYLQKIDSKAAGLLRELFPNLLISVLSVNPIISFAEDPYAHASHSMISRLRKTFRKNNTLEFKLYDTNLDTHFEEILTMQKNTSKSEKSMDIFQDKRIKAYYRSMTKQSAKNVSIGFLYLDKEPIGYAYALTYGDTYLGEQIAFHSKYRALSPGKLMLFSLIEILKEKKVKTFDLGGGISDYKMSFTQDYRLLYNITTSPNKLILFWWKAINSARRLKQVVSPKKFTRDHEFLFKSFTNA